MDYKTDQATKGRRIEALVEHYLPQVRLYAAASARCTEEPVKEIGLYFTSVGRYEPVAVQE